MKQSIADSIFLLLGIIVAMSIVTFVSMIGSLSNRLNDDKVNKEANMALLEKVADANPYTDISRVITGDDVIEFITDNGAVYDYYIHFKNGSVRAIVKDSIDFVTAKQSVIDNLPDDVLPGDAESYANTALWSQYYLSSEVFDTKVTSDFKPMILVNHTSEEDSVNTSQLSGEDFLGWTKYKDSGKTLQYTFMDVVDTDAEFIIVYVEQ